MAEINPWAVVTTETDETMLRDRNTVHAVSNGYLTIKGNLAEERGADHPTTLVAGVFDAADWIAFIRPTAHERRFHDPEHFDNAEWSPSVANLPDPVHLRVFIGSRELTTGTGRIEAFQQQYEMARGLYVYEYDHVDPDGRRTAVRMERFCSMTHTHRAHLRYTITPRNYDETVRIVSGINAAIRSNLHNEKQVEAVELEPISEGRCRILSRTIHSRIECETIVRTRFPGEAARYVGPLLEDAIVSHVYEVEAREGEPVVLEKEMVVATGEDEVHGAACDLDAQLDAATDDGFEEALREQERFWAAAWDRLDVQIEGDPEAQRNLRFCLAHLLSAAPRHSDRLSVPCKLLTGEFYQGTVFYDTDLYIEPVFLFTFPDVARRMLNYRWHGIEPGRRIARRLGYRGVKLAWQAGPYGEEELGLWWRYTYLNIHINADVCYSLMLYLAATDDVDFVADRGIDLLVESARFYVSRADVDGETGRYNLTTVAGPDEGHCESRNNFYTNHLAARCLRDAASMLERIRDERPDAYAAAVERLGIGGDEPEEWARAADGLVILYHPETKLYEQCEGFFDLPDAPADLLRDRPFWWTIVYPHRAIYQPDVCMALALDRDRFDPEVLRANYEYYRPITLNFSSMSFVINSIIGAEAGDLDYAYDQFLTAAALDLDPATTGRNDIYEGIHGTNAGGAWMAAVFGFGGLTVSNRGVSIRPRLPEKWTSLRYRFRIHGESITCTVTRDRVRLEAASEAEIELPIRVGDTEVVLRSGERVDTPLG